MMVDNNLDIRIEFINRKIYKLNSDHISLEPLTCGSMEHAKSRLPSIPRI